VLINNLAFIKKLFIPHTASVKKIPSTNVDRRVGGWQARAKKEKHTLLTG
jgi:hypothetical protein